MSITAELDDSPVDRTFGSPTIITVDGEHHHELRRALDAKYRPRHVNTYIDALVRPIAAELLPIDPPISAPPVAASRCLRLILVPAISSLPV